jgi:hypothetical protein
MSDSAALRHIGFSRATPLLPRKDYLGLRRTGLRVLEGGRDAAPEAVLPKRKALVSEFSPAAKLTIRTRAGNGGVDDTHCEGCAVWLGRYDGAVVRRRPTAADIVSAVNAVLLCGSLLSGCRGLTERRDPLLNARGFWLRSGEDPALVPMLLRWISGAEFPVWLKPDGTYGYEDPA